MWRVVHIREGSLKLTGFSKAVEILVKLLCVMIFNSLLTCCISNQAVDRYLYLFRKISHHCIDEFTLLNGG